MKDQLVENSIHILNLFSSNNCATGLNVNEIFRKTGSKDKKSITDSIRYLEKARLLETKKSKEHSQKRFKMPTTLGNEFLNFMNDIKEFNDACLKLRTKLYRSLEIIHSAHEKLVVQKLKQEGWSEQDLDSVDNIQKWLKPMLGQSSPTHVIDIILLRYISLLSKLIVDNNNEYAKPVLNQIVMDEISHQFSVIINRGESDKIAQTYSNLTLDQWNQAVGSVVKSHYLHYQFIRNEYRNFEVARLRALTPTDETINMELETLKTNAKGWMSTKEGEVTGRELMSVVTLLEEAYNRKLT
jgi:hypothetical protein